MKKPIVICVAIHKGGAAKTTMTGNLSYALSKAGYKVLMIDTDSQKSLSSWFGFSQSDAHYQNKNFFTLLGNIWGDNKELGDIRNHILKTPYENIDMVIGSRNLAKASESLGSIDYAEQIVGDILQPLREDKSYDFIVIDTDSTIGTLNTSVMQASDKVLISLTPTSFGFEGLATFISHFKFVKKRSKADVEILGIAFSDIDIRECLSIDIPEAVVEFIENNEPTIKVFKTQIPKDTNVKKSQGDHMPVGYRYPSSRSVVAYDELAKEVVNYVQSK